jgi:hypothetical protein
MQSYKNSKTIKVLAFVLLSFSISACMPRRELQEYRVRAPFDEAMAKTLLLPGTGTIKGNAFLRQNGGGVVTCAGSTVSLIPATGYAKERMMMIYGSYESGYTQSAEFKFHDDNNSYFVHTRTTKCDSQGNFEFGNVAAGEFYVSTIVSWTVGYARQGGALMHKYTITDGRVSTEVLTQ